jgi:LCP family protein required for cell wall assembly
MPSEIEHRTGTPRPRRLRFGLRFLVGCLIVFACAAGAGAAFTAHQIGTLRAALSENPSLDIASGTLAPAGWGDPQTLLLVGNDQRAHTTTTPVLPHSNEMLLVRFDPSKPWISMMSIPRELLVTIYPPNAPPVQNRFNYALTAGGIPLLVKTIKQVLGLQVNHVVEIDFHNFERAVNEIGCVYATIDRRYYHVNVPGGPQYTQLNLQPGYQKMCGQTARLFVSYRHGDTSLIRDARDQRFLIAARQQYGPSLINNISKFERIFGQTVQTDPSLHTTTGLDNLIGTLISTGDEPVRQVQFPVNLDPSNPVAQACACVTSTPQQISEAVHSFLYGVEHVPAKQTAQTAKQVATAVRHHKPPPGQRGLVATPASELASARSVAGRLPFPLEFPRVADDSLAPPGAVDLNSCPADFFQAQMLACMRTYLIHGPHGTPYPTYVLVQNTGLLGQFYDVQGSTWTDAPQFRNPNQTLSVGGRTYYLYYEGSHISLIAWFEHHAAYWIANSLTDAVSNGDLLSIAEQTEPVGGPTASAPAARRLRLKAVRAPKPLPLAAETQQGLSIGALCGLLALVCLPLCAVAVLLQRRRAKRARLELERALFAGLDPGAAMVGAAPNGRPASGLHVNGLPAKAPPSNGAGSPEPRGARPPEPQGDGSREPLRR